MKKNKLINGHCTGRKVGTGTVVHRGYPNIAVCLVGDVTTFNVDLDPLLGFGFIPANWVGTARGGFDG